MYKYKNNKNTNGPQLLRLLGLLKFCFGDSPQRMFYNSLDMLITIVINYHRRQRIVWQKGQTQKIHNVLLPFAFDLWFRRIRLEIIYRFFLFSGNSLKVCQSHQSCCNAATEVQLIDMVDDEYKRHLAGQAGYVYDLLNSTAHHLQGKQKTKNARRTRAPADALCADGLVHKKKPLWHIRIFFYYY